MGLEWIYKLVVAAPTVKKAEMKMLTATSTWNNS
jgi:hypothetical protein